MDHTIRERAEALESPTLSPRACLSAQSKGRRVDIPPYPMRTCFQRDIDRVVHCKSFRRLKHKTQVFLQPEGDHYRTRLTHTLEVSRIARTMARALFLNEDLTEAIALGHDLGHTPFGHAGERALSRMVEGGFRHYEQSLRVVDRLENDGAGLNLCHEVRDGILCHTAGRPADTLEGQLVRFADKIAYINHDIDDAMRGGVIFPTDIPAHISQTLGYTHGERIETLTLDIIRASGEGDAIRQSPPVAEAMAELDKKTNEMLIKNARNTVEQSKMTARLASGSSIKIETLETTWRTIVNGIDETRAIQENARKQRTDDAARLETIKQEFLKSYGGVKQGNKR